MAIRWDKFTVKSQEAIQQATELASQNGNPELLPIHILAALLQDREGIITPVITRLGANPANVLSQLTRAYCASAQSLWRWRGGSRLSASAQKILDQAFKEADKFKDEYVSTEHLLLAIAEDKDKSQ